MNAFARSLDNAAPNIPLANLFAYIRDLFHTAQPELHFDDTDLSRQKVNHWIALQDIHFLRDQALANLQWQSDSPEKPLLSLKRIHVQDLPPLPKALEAWIKVSQEGKITKNKWAEAKFSSSPERVKAFEDFYKNVHGKKLDQVQDVSIPEELTNWISIDQKGDKVIVEKIEKGEEKFEANPQREVLLKAYKCNLSQLDQSRENQQRSNDFYDTIHDWHYRLKAQPELQLFLSFGLFQGGSGKNSYKNYLFHIPLKLELNRQELRLSVDSIARNISCEQHFTELIPQWFADEPEHMHEQRQREVIRYIDQFNEQKKDFSLETEDLRQQFYFPALDLLGIFPSLEDKFFDQESLNLDFPEKTKDENRFILSYSPIIQLRHPGNHINVSKDASLIMDKIQELNKKDPQEGGIPSFFRKMFSLKKAENPLRIVHQNKDFQFKMEKVISEKLSPRYYFPLPYNEEQLAIARRLEEVDAATVQGPPGTGKSHTIANLAAHYAARGKSVLVVSKYAKALEVIRGKLPANIRDLAVSLTDNEQHREALKHSIDAVKSRLHDTIRKEDIEAKEGELKSLEEEYQKLFNTLAAAISQNYRPLSLFDVKEREWKTQALTQWFESYKEEFRKSSILRDDLSNKIDIEGLAKSLHPLLSQSCGVDFSLRKLFLPAPEDLPQLEEVASWVDTATGWNAKTQSDEGSIPSSLLGESSLRQWRRLKEGLQILLHYKALLNHPNFQRDKLEKILLDSRTARKKVEEGREKYLNFQVNLASLQGQEKGIILAVVRQLLSKFNKQGKIPLWKKASLSSREKEVFAISINGKMLESKDDLKVLEEWLDWSYTQSQLEILTQNYLGIFRLNKEELPSSGIGFWQDLEKALRLYEELEKWNEILLKAGLEAFDPLDQGAYRQVEFFDDLEYHREYRLAMDRLRALATRIPQQKHSLLEQMKNQLQGGEVKAYEQSFEAYVELSKESAQSRELAQELGSYRSVLPLTLASIFEKGLDEVPSLDDLLRQLLVAQLRQAAKLILDDKDPVKNQIERLREIGQEKISLLGQLVELKAWRQRQESISDEQRSALSAWRNDLINLGKGFGKNADQHLESAIKNLQLAREIVPIWIMSLDSAIRFFPDPQPGQFDLLIIDEASQVDISALNLIFRARKTLIVGDENQTSVFTNSALFPIERTNQILDRYLNEHPFKQQFNINNRTASIYSLSGVIYPNIITLKEHFRCRPEIIAFSNKFVYNRHMIPLRTPTHQWYGPAAEVKYVEDEGRNKKKPAIVREVLRLIEDTLQAYQSGEMPKLPSIGILCLDSSNEAHREAIYKALFKSPQVKAYQDELQLLIGTSREFQGDERDVMILTSTASHTLTKAGVIRPPRAVKGEEMMRIYNVAVSRAREKVILLHSIHPEALPLMKPECYRGRLIHYLQDKVEQPEPDENKGPRRMPKTGIAMDIQAWVIERHPEWQVKPGLRIGPYHMDLALVSEKGKIALWCDEKEGDHSISRQLQQQMILERAGWKGYRVQALDWYANPETIKEDLKSMLK